MMILMIMIMIVVLVMVLVMMLTCWTDVCRAAGPWAPGCQCAHVGQLAAFKACFRINSAFHGVELLCG